MTAACADQTSIIDEFPPHEWHGVGGCTKWIADYEADSKKNGITDGVVTLGTPKHVDVTADRAYVVVPADYSYKQKGKPVKETASMSHGGPSEECGRLAYYRMGAGRRTRNPALDCPSYELEVGLVGSARLHPSMARDRRMPPVHSVVCIRDRDDLRADARRYSGGAVRVPAGHRSDHDSRVGSGCREGQRLVDSRRAGDDARNRPMYRFGGRNPTTVFADTGDRFSTVAAEDALSLARHFAPDSASTVRYVGLISNPDQWTLQSRAHLPLHHIALGDHARTEIDVSTRTGDVVMKTTGRERLSAYFGPIAHGSIGRCCAATDRSGPT